jgi:hypothetical protein
VVSCAVVKLGVVGGKNLFPQMTCKHRVSVTDNAGRRAMKLDDMFGEQISHCLHCVWVCQGKKMCIFSEAINHYQYHVFSSGFRQA